MSINQIQNKHLVIYYTLTDVVFNVKVFLSDPKQSFSYILYPNRCIQCKSISTKFRKGIVNNKPYLEITKGDTWKESVLYEGILWKKILKYQIKRIMR